MLPVTIDHLAGDFSEKGYVNGRGEEARFQPPLSLSFANEDCLYIADGGNNRIRRLDLNTRMQRTKVLLLPTYGVYC